MANEDTRRRAGLRSRLEHALERGGHPVAHLADAGTSVSFRIDDEQPVTLLLDREPVELTDDPSAEIVITLHGEVGAAFARGELVLATALMAGAGVFEGPIRKYLAVDPIIRGLLCVVEHGTPWHERFLVGSDHRVAAPADIDLDGLLAVQTKAVHKSFGSNSILRGVSVQIPEGTISTILGPSGTGKSVMIKHILGLLSPDKGEVFVHGRGLHKMSRSDVLELRRDVGVMFQDGALFSSMDIYDNVAFPLRQHTDLREDEIRGIVDYHLDAVGLGGAAGRAPKDLSGGMRKRAGLARALALDPGIVLCDEPDSGLDPVRTALLGELLLERQSDIGGTMIVVTHNIALARKISDHISVLWRGEIIESGPADRVWESEDPFVRQFLSGEAEGPLGMDA